MDLRAMRVQGFRFYMQLGMVCFVGMCLIGLGLCDATSQSTVAKTTTGLWGLKHDPAVGLVVANCGNCHTPYLITHHHRDRESWDKTITKMESNGLVPPAPVIRHMLLDYLEKHQGALKEDRPEASPWGHADFDTNPLWD